MTTSVPSGSLRPTRRDTADLVSSSGRLQLQYDDRDRTRPFLVLHGGGGPATVSAFSDLLAERTHSRVLTPIHPGFAGTVRPDALASTRELAAAYVALLDDLEFSDVTVIGNSFGGWLAAEIALLGSARVSGAVLVDAIGIEVQGHPMTKVAGLAPAELQKLSFHDPSRAPHPAGAQVAGGLNPDIQALTAYAGPAMSDPTLLDRLGDLDLPVHVIWGASDGIVDPEYGRAYAAAIPLAAFTQLEHTGHLPQVETPEELLGAILDLGGEENPS